MSRVILLISIRIYTWLILIYPKSFRREYGIEIVLVFRDMSVDAMKRKGCWGLISVWSLVLPELWLTASQQHLIAGSYYRWRRIKNSLIQAFVSLLVLVLGLMYLVRRY